MARVSYTAVLRVFVRGGEELVAATPSLSDCRASSVDKNKY